MSFINKPLGWILSTIASGFNGNFAVAVFIFTVIINIILIPLSIKSQKSSMQQTRVKPKLDELKKRCGDDRQKYSQGMQEIYSQEGVSMSGGCLPMILRLILMMCIYSVILSPLVYLSGADSDKIKNVDNVISSAMADLKKENKEEYDKKVAITGWKEKNGRNQLNIIGIIRSDDDVLDGVLDEKEYAKVENDLADIKKKDSESNIDYTFISKKINLTETPKFSFDIFGAFKPIWLMPLIAFLSQLLSSYMSLKMQKKINPDAPSMAGMMYTMPLISLFIGFGLPGGVSFYWACSSLIGGFIQVGVQYFYGPFKMLSNERKKELLKQCDFEAGQIKKLGTADTEN